MMVFTPSSMGEVGDTAKNAFFEVVGLGKTHALDGSPANPAESRVRVLEAAEETAARAKKSREYLPPGTVLCAHKQNVAEPYKTATGPAAGHRVPRKENSRLFAPLPHGGENGSIGIGSPRAGPELRFGGLGLV